MDPQDDEIHIDLSISRQITNATQTEPMSNGKRTKTNKDPTGQNIK
jgi:hypothetical protein